MAAQAFVATESTGGLIHKPRSLRNLPHQFVVGEIHINVVGQVGQGLGDVATQLVVVHSQVVQRLAVS